MLLSTTSIEVLGDNLMKLSPLDTVRWRDEHGSSPLHIVSREKETRGEEKK